MPLRIGKSQQPTEKITATISREHLQMLRTLRKHLALKYGNDYELSGSDVIMQAIACLFRQEQKEGNLS